MTETEKRRNALLEQTRKMYSDKYAPPAVHPRYQAIYKSIYKIDTEKQEGQKTSSLGVRFVIAILLFGVFAIASENDMEEAKKVVNVIQQEFDGFVDLQIFR